MPSHDSLIEDAAVLAVQSLVNTTGAESRGSVIAAHEAAFRGGGPDTIMSTELGLRRGNEQSIVYFEDCRALLAAWRRDGLSAAVTRRARLDTLRGIRMAGERPERATYEIAITRKVRGLLEPEHEPVPIAVYRDTLASALINGTGEEPTRTDMLVDALDLLGQSIPVYEEWALTDRW